MAFNWPDVSEQGVEILMARDPESQKRIAIFRSTTGSFGKALEASFKAVGYAKKDMDGEPVFEASGGLKGSDVKRLFPDFKLQNIETADDRARISYDGLLKTWQEPAPETQSDIESEHVSEASAPLETSASNGPDDFHRPHSEAAEGTPETDARSAASATAVTDTVDAGTTASSEVNNLPDGFAELLRAYLVHEGVPMQAREEFLEAADDMSKTLGFDVAFANRDQKPQDLRHDYKKVATDKELAKSRIIDCMVPFVWSLQDKSDAMKQGFIEFADNHGSEMDGYINQLTEFMDDFVKVETSKNVMNTFERMLRVTGARAISVLATIEEQGQFGRVSREFAKEDPRIAVLNSTTYANLRMPLTKIRKTEEFRQRLEEMWTGFKANLEPSGPTP